MISIAERYKDIILRMIANSQKQHVITEENVWQEGNVANRKLFETIVDDLMLPGSGIHGVKHLVELHKKAQEGKACLLLVEHYSNFDLPCLSNLLARAHKDGQKIADDLVAMAGFKLNEESPVVLAFAEAFSRIIIYPSRTIEALPDSDEKEAELKRAGRINLAAMRAMSKAKTSGKIVLVFPAGTRYRPGKPETKKGVKEIDSYIKAYDYMCFVSINGNTLELNTKGGMEEDIGTEDVIIYGVGPVLSCDEFRKMAQADCPENEDSKQFTVDRVMEELDRLHEQYEPVRLELLKKTTLA